ncbi:MAG: shikimate kinase [Anaerolineae bacterium]|nr:shikimate kinase [Gemmatimonadaceae bacterium]
MFGVPRGVVSTRHKPLIIILVGLSGSGKSTVGPDAALRLGWRFVDLDREIERRVGLAVSDIFSRKGEAYFRGLERDLTAELLNTNDGRLMISSGGGWITNSAAVELALIRSRVIYLKVSPETALARLGSDRHSRPLLRGSDPLGSLRRLQIEREEYYSQAHWVIDTEVGDLQWVVAEVVRLGGVEPTE